jgi:hypothetical protein
MMHEWRFADDIPRFQTLFSNVLTLLTTRALHADVYFDWDIYFPASLRNVQTMAPFCTT